MATSRDVINKLPGKGKKFWAERGPSSLKKQLYSITKHGRLQNLRDNMDTIMNLAKKREGLIRKGKYSRKQRLSDYREIIKNPKLNKDDKREIKMLLEHWGANSGQTAQTSSPETSKTRRADDDFSKNIAQRGSVFDRMPEIDRSQPGPTSSPLSRKKYGSNISSNRAAGNSSPQIKSSPSSGNSKLPRLVK